jgi:NTE family protein
MKRALVLGGGGAVGIAWETAVVAGLLDAGLDVREADLIIGTSAGSVVGTHLAHGRDPRELLAEPPRENTPRAAAAPEPDIAQLTALFTLWSSFDRMTPEHAAQVGRLALAAKTVPEDDWVQGFADINFDGWPQKPLLLTAVDCESGELAVWDRDRGAPIERAVASSCSVPGMFPPVTINGRRYTDGGVRSGTSADLAQRIEPDIVLIIATMGASERGIGRLAAQQIATEKGELEAAGAKVPVVMFDDATKAAAGPNLMDPSRRPAVIETGRAQGQRIAAELLEIWSPQ